MHPRVNACLGACAWRRNCCDAGKPSHGASPLSDHLLPQSSVLSASHDRRRPLRIAAVDVAPWVVRDGHILAGIEIDAALRYCAWRGRAAHFVDARRETLPALFAADRIDLAIGGLIESTTLAAHARLLPYAKHTLRHGEARHAPPRRHVWAASPRGAVELLALRSFLFALRTIGARRFVSLAPAR